MVPVKLKSYEMIEEENKELKTMMRKLCHEMGNALTLLGGSIFYLENELRTKEIGDVVDIKNDYTYICKLFNNLREYNHTEAIEKTNVSLTDIVENIKNIFEKMNVNSDTELQVEYPMKCKEDMVYADMTKIRQVLINVMKNSIEAMEQNVKDKGKCIVARVSTEVVPYQDYVEIEEDMNFNNEKRKVVHIEIRDNGKGIPEKNLNDIFQPMYTYGKEQGSGLGLAVVKKIIEDHRGKIKAVSAVGTGTAMHIYLPVSNTCCYQ